MIPPSVYASPSTSFGANPLPSFPNADQRVASPVADRVQADDEIVDVVKNSRVLVNERGICVEGDRTEAQLPHMLEDRIDDET